MTTVAVINTSVETLEVLQATLEDEAYTVVTAYVVDLKRNQADIKIFFQTHRPQAVVFDVALPYAENWAFFRDLVLLPGYLPEYCFVLTTTNKRVLEELVGSTHAIELVGRPFDLEMIVAGVRRVVDRQQHR